MVTGTYEINSVSCNRREPRDDSFRLCMCSMIVFIGLCCSVLTINSLVKPVLVDKKPTSPEDTAEIAKQHGGVFKETRTYSTNKVEETTEKSTHNTRKQGGKIYYPIHIKTEIYSTPEKTKNIESSTLPVEPEKEKRYYSKDTLTEYITKILQKSTFFFHNISSTEEPTIVQAVTDPLSDSTPSSVISNFGTNSITKTEEANNTKEFYYTSKYSMTHMPEAENETKSTSTYNNFDTYFSNLLDSEEERLSSEPEPKYFFPEFWFHYNKHKKFSVNPQVSSSPSPIPNETSAIFNEKNTPPNSYESSSESNPFTSSYSEATRSQSSRNLAPGQTRSCLQEITCNSIDCKFVASQMLSLMDHRADPCEDFYQFSCGNSLANYNSILEKQMLDADKRILDYLDKVILSSPESHKVFQEMYTNCLYHHEKSNLLYRLETARELLDSIGEIKRTKKPPPQSLTQLMVKLHQHGSPILFDVDLDVSSKNSSVYNIVLTAPKKSSLLSPYSYFIKQCESILSSAEEMSTDVNQHYEKYILCKKNNTTYLDSIQEALTNLGYFHDMNQAQETWMVQDIRVSVDWSILMSLEKFPAPGHQQISFITKDMKEMTIKDLQNTLPLIQWLTFFSELFPFDLKDESIVQVYFERSFIEIFENLAEQSERQVQTAMLAVFAESIYREMVLQNPCDRKHYCLQMTKSLMPDIASTLFLQSFTKPQLEAIEKEVQEISSRLINTFKDEVNKLDCFDKESKLALGSELDSLFLPSPEEMPKTYVHKSLQDFPLRGEFFLDFISMLKRKQAMKYYFYDKNPHDAYGLWFKYALPYSNQEIIIHGVNALLIPLTISSILVDEKIPRYKQLSILRQTIARGITHVFDTTGFLYHEGKKKILFSDLGTFTTYRKTIENNGIHSYDKTISVSRKGKEMTIHLDPYLSLSLRLADLTATKLGFLMIDKSSPRLLWGGFSKEQEYFITLMQDYCSSEPFLESIRAMFEEEYLHPLLRVRNIVSNSEEFTAAFNCSSKSNMNPIQKLIPFPWFRKV